MPIDNGEVTEPTIEDIKFAFAEMAGEYPDRKIMKMNGPFSKIFHRAEQVHMCGWTANKDNHPADTAFAVIQGVGMIAEPRNSN